MDIQIRDVTESDFPIFFEHQRDRVSARMAAFGTRDPDRDEFAARWKKSLHDGLTTQKAIIVDGNAVGFVASFMREEQLEVTYWIARSHWGRGIATSALSQLCNASQRVPSARERRRTMSGPFACWRNAALPSAAWAELSRSRAAEKLTSSFWS